MSDIPKEVIKEAQSIGFETAEFVGHWTDGEIYVPTSSEEMTVGLPIFIIFKDGKTRLTEDGEWQKIMDFYFADDE